MLEEEEVCPDCETVLVYRDDDGTLLKFTAHDAEFCKLGMKVLIKSLRDGMAMANDRANYAQERLLRQMHQGEQDERALFEIAKLFDGKCQGEMYQSTQRDKRIGRWSCKDCGYWTDSGANRPHNIKWKDPETIKLIRDRMLEYLDGRRR